jgi:protein SCO1/2
MLIAILAILMGVGSWLIFRAVTGGLASSGLPMLGEAPEFQLIERSGKTVSRADLAGSVWVADFIFTRCQGICPLLSTRMAALQQHLQKHPAGRQVRLISFSVDPEWDTPERLQEYAKRYHADPGYWFFLTGPIEVVTHLITQGFHLAVAKAPADSHTSATEPIVHSDRLVLIDSTSHIRGYYHGMDQEDFDRLLRDVEMVRREQ